MFSRLFNRKKVAVPAQEEPAVPQPVPKDLLVQIVQAIDSLEQALTSARFELARLEASRGLPGEASALATVREQSLKQHIVGLEARIAELETQRAALRTTIAQNSGLTVAQADEIRRLMLDTSASTSVREEVTRDIAESASDFAADRQSFLDDLVADAQAISTTEARERSSNREGSQHSQAVDET